MKIEILEYIEDVRGVKLANVDIKVIHEEGKHEIFRNLSYFRNEKGSWLSMPNVKRNDQWVPYYERQSNNFRDVLSEARKVVSAKLSTSNTSLTEKESLGVPGEAEDYGVAPVDTFEF